MNVTCLITRIQLVLLDPFSSTLWQLDIKMKPFPLLFTGTAFAYGQTSSGKTFTMNGSERDPGIIQRAVEEIFERIQMVIMHPTAAFRVNALSVTVCLISVLLSQMSDREFLIRVSYMEIYNEEINDLFAVENQKLQIHESLEVDYWHLKTIFKNQP